MASSYMEFITKEYSPTLESLRDDLAKRKDPHFFWPSGTQVYCGRQGSGKTTAAVKHATIDLKLRYPKCILVSNLKLTYYKPLRTPRTRGELENLLQNIDTTTEYIFFSTMDELKIVLTKVNNGFLGVCYVIDEIHTYFNSLDSKNVPPWVFTEIAQQRKQRKVIIGTSQLFTRMAKPFREQCDSLIACRTIFGFWTFVRAYDGMTMRELSDGGLYGNVKRSGWFFHNRKIRNAFDTYQKINSGNVDMTFSIDEKPEKKRRFGRARSAAS